MIIACCCPILHNLIVLLSPPKMLYLVPFWVRMDMDYVYCLIAHRKIPLFFLCSYLTHVFLYAACLWVWPVYLRLVSAFFWLSSDFLMPWSFHILVDFPDVLFGFLFEGLAYICIVYSLFIGAFSHQCSSFRHYGSCWWRYPRFQWLVALCWIIRFRWWFRCRLVLVVSIIGFSIPVRIRSSLTLFVWYLLLVASWSSIVSFPPLRPVWYCSLPFCCHFQCWLCWWLLRLWQCLAC